MNKYWIKTSEEEFLTYGEGEIPKELSEDIQLVEENINILERPELHELALFKLEDVFLRLLGKKRTRDKVLSEEGIISFTDLRNAYFLCRCHELKKSKRIREYVEEKYSEIINLEYEPTTDNSSESETKSNAEDGTGDN